MEQELLIEIGDMIQWKTMMVKFYHCFLVLEHRLLFYAFV